MMTSFGWMGYEVTGMEEGEEEEEEKEGRGLPYSLTCCSPLNISSSSA